MRIFILIQLTYILHLQSGTEGKCDLTPLKSKPPDKEFFYCNESRNWEEAKQECERNNLTLSKIRNDYESMILREYIKTHTRGNLHVWTGLKLYENYTTEEQYGEWSDGTLFYYRNDGIKHYDESYAAWLKAEPKVGQDRCVHLLWRKYGYVWDNWKCSMKRTFFCETRSVQASQAPPKGKLQDQRSDGQKEGLNVSLSIVSEPVTEPLPPDVRYSILDDIDNLPATRQNAEAIMKALDRVLVDDDNFYLRNANRSRYVVRAFHDFIARYQDGEAFISMPNLHVSVNVSEAEHPLTYQAYGTSGESTALHLETNLLKEAMAKSNHSNSIQVGSIAYRSSKLFQPDEQLFTDIQKSNAQGYVKVQRLAVEGLFGESEQVRLPPHVLSGVLSSEVSNVTLKDLKNKLNVTIQLDCKNQPETAELQDMVPVHEEVRCAFWDVQASNWSTNGCRVVHTSGKCHSWRYPGLENIEVTCECDHMTHFTAILDTSYTYAPLYIGYLNMLGCVISAFFLLLTAIAILSFRHMRKDTNKVIIANIVINLFIMNLVFVIGIDGRSNPYSCLATSFILHYFTLTSWLWMLIEALHLLMTLSFLDRNGLWKRYVLLIFGVLAYVIPGIIAAVAMTVFDQYTSVKFCWIAPKVAIYTLALPVAAVLVVNMVMAAYTMYKMTCGFKLRSVKRDRAWLHLSIKRSLCLVFLLGLPWTFGMLMLLCQTPESKDVFATIFAVCNMLQGLIIFIAFCAMDEKFRRTLRSVCSACKGDVIEKPPTSASYTTRPATNQIQTEKRLLERTAADQENPSRKTTLTTLSPSPMIESRTVNPIGLDNMIVNSEDTPEQNNAFPPKTAKSNEVDEERTEKQTVHRPLRKSKFMEETNVPDGVADAIESSSSNTYLYIDTKVHENGDTFVPPTQTPVKSHSTIMKSEKGKDEVLEDDCISTDSTEEFDEMSGTSSVLESFESMNIATVNRKFEVQYEVQDGCIEISHHSDQIVSSESTCNGDSSNSYLGQSTERPFRNGWV